MNIEQAKSIQLFTLLDKMGFKPTPKKGNEYLYFSPFRNEKTPSFRVNTHKNVWFDFGEGSGGDTVEFVRTYLKSLGKGSSVSESLKWLDENFNNLEALAQKPKVPKSPPKTTMILRDVQPISRQGLIV